MLFRLLVCVAAVWLAAGSASPQPLKLKPRFDRTGVYDPAARATPIVTSAADVKVYYGTSPPGFTLRENELAVESGYSHQILGTIKVLYEDGSCYAGHGTKADLIRYLQESAFANGGNAVIYARSGLPDVQPKEGELCVPYGDEDFGGGWAVVLREPPAAPADPRAPAALAP